MLRTLILLLLFLPFIRELTVTPLIHIKPFPPCSLTPKVLTPFLPCMLHALYFPEHQAVIIIKVWGSGCSAWGSDQICDGEQGVSGKLVFQLYLFKLLCLTQPIGHEGLSPRGNEVYGECEDTQLEDSHVVSAQVRGVIYSDP